MKDMMYGVDLSHWNTVTDVHLAKISGGVEFAMLKLGGSDARKPYIDKAFNKHYNMFKSVAVYIGCYFFAGSNFKGTLEGKKCAEFVIDYLKRNHIVLDMPVVIDVEKGSAKDRNKITLATVEFCEQLEKAGYYVMIYGADVSTFKTLLHTDVLEKYDKWVARYGNRPAYVKDYGIWQWTSKGKVNGIKGNVDCNIAFKDYPAIIANMRKEN